jgi:hypothetical protein
VFLCIHYDSTAGLTASEVSVASACPATDYLAVQPADFTTVSQLSALFDTYFAFDAELFGYLIGATIAAYAIGLGGGYVVRLMVGSKHYD